VEICVHCNASRTDRAAAGAFASTSAGGSKAPLDRHVRRTTGERRASGEGFRCELKVEAINRVALQLLFAAQFPLAYLARINNTIERLLDMYV
jgi:hypothetical protein